MSYEIHTISDSEESNISLSVIDDGWDQINSPPKIKKRKMTKEIRLKVQEEKQNKKLEKQRKAEMLKCMKPGECLKYITSVIDSKLLSKKYSGKLLVALQSANIKHEIKDQSIPFSISWKRKQPSDSNECEESEVIIVWTYSEFINHVYKNSLCTELSNISRSSQKTFILIIYQIDEYFRLLKSKSSRNKKNDSEHQAGNRQNEDDNTGYLPTLTRLQIEIALTELQVMRGICHRFVQNGEELGLVVSQLTKSVAEKPFKLDKYKKMGEEEEWFASADSKECVNVDGEGNGLLRLWQQQICQFNNVSLEVAQAIVSRYNFPALLLQAYDKCKTEKEARHLLKDIPVRRGNGPLSSVRKVGPELSNKLYLLFNSVDSETQLSTQE